MSDKDTIELCLSDGRTLYLPIIGPEYAGRHIVVTEWLEPNRYAVAGENRNGGGAAFVVNLDHVVTARMLR